MEHGGAGDSEFEHWRRQWNEHLRKHVLLQSGGSDDRHRDDYAMSRRRRVHPAVQQHLFKCEYLQQRFRRRIRRDEWDGEHRGWRDDDNQHTEFPEQRFLSPDELWILLQLWWHLQ